MYLEVCLAPCTVARQAASQRLPLDSAADGVWLACGGDSEDLTDQFSFPCPRSGLHEPIQHQPAHEPRRIWNGRPGRFGPGTTTARPLLHVGVVPSPGPHRSRETSYDRNSDETFAPGSREKHNSMCRSCDFSSTPCGRRGTPVPSQGSWNLSGPRSSEDAECESWESEYIILMHYIVYIVYCILYIIHDI